MTNTNKILLLLLGFSLLMSGINCAGSKGVEPLVTILDITTDITRDGSNSAYRSGSVYGGTVLYIKASGQSLIASENAVTIGPYACVHDPKLDTSTSNIYIVCVTQAAIYADRRWSQEVIVHTAGRPDSKCLAGHGCLFSFSESFTPVLWTIVPRSASAGETVNWYAIAEVDNTSKIKEMVVNGQRCELDELVPGAPDALNPSEDLTEWARYQFPCKLSKEITGGFYPSNFKTVFGNSRKLAILPSVGGPTPSVTYDFVNVPEIKTVSTNTIGDQGALLTLTGTGFTTDTNKVSVSAGGLGCTIRSATNNQVVCEVAAGTTTNGALNIGGGGVIYQKYTGLAQSTPEDFRTLLTGATPPTPAFNGVMGEVDLYTTERNTYHFWSGVFVAPEDGAFIFFVNSGDRIAAYISDTDLGTVPLTPTIKRTYGNSFRLPLRTEKTNAYSTPISLTKGGKYRFEVYGINNVDFGHFSLGVIIPSAVAAVNSVPYVINFKISYNPNREKITVASSLSSGTFTFGFQDTIAATSNYTPRTNIKTFNWDATCATILSGVGYNSLNLACIRNANGAGFQWVITVNEYREDYVTMVPKGTGVSVIDEPSDEPITGTYKIKYATAAGNVYLSVGGTTDIPYNVNAWDLNWALRSALNLDTVFDWQFTKAYDGIDHYIQIYTQNQPLPLFSTEYAGTLNGKGAKVEYLVVNQASSDLELNSIPHEFLNYESATTSVVITVNDVQGKCSANDCSFVAAAATTQNFAITNWDNTSKQLTLTLAGLSDTQVTPSQVQIKFGNSNCIQPTVTGNPAVIVCTIETDSQGNRYVEGGNNLPRVNINAAGLLPGYGYLKTTDSAVAITPTITTLSTAVGGTNGGTTVLITGTNFPKTGSLTTLEVLFGANQAVILSKTNTIIVVESPPNAAEVPVQVTVVVNSLASAGTTFTYNGDNVVLTSSTVLSASPVLKTDGVLTGSNFGTQTEELEVVLKAKDQTKNQDYSLLVWQVNAAGTQIDYTFIGGHKGLFELYVKRKGYGKSLSLNFAYEITVTAIAPTTGSIAGGTELTITGTNFSLDQLENNVFLGSISGFDNKICHVTSCTATQIKCLTPAGYDWQVGTNPNVQSIIVQGRLIEDADYTPGVYSFTYTSDASTPTVAQPSTTSYKAGDTVTLTGTNLSTSAKVFLDSTEVTPVTASATSVSFTFPGLISGKYVLRVYNPNLGDAVLGTISARWDGKVTNNFWVGAPTPATGSSAGNLITIPVNGLDTTQLPRVVFGVNGECAYISHTTSQIVCRTPKITGADTITVTQDTTLPVDSQVKLTGGSYTGSASGAPTITSATKSVTGVTTSVSITGTGLSGTTSAVFELKSNRNVFYAGTVTVPTATSATVTIDNLPAGEYLLRYLVSGSGYAVNTMVPEFSVTTVLNPTIATAYESSIAGGQTLTLNGSGYSLIQDQNKVTIGGLECPVTSATATQLQCTLPRYNTKITKSLYKFTDNSRKVEPTKQFTNEDASGKVDPLLLMNGATDAYYTSAATNCYVGYDFGLVRVGVTQIQFYPRSIGLNSAASHTGGVFEGSVDGVTWVLIYQLPSAHLGKNIYRPSLETAGFRFVRYRNNRPTFPLSNCEITELEVFGNVYSSEDFSMSISDNNGEKTLSAVVTVNQVSITVPNAVQYLNTNSKTPVVTSVNPRYGTIKGGTDVTFKGTYLVTAATTEGNTNIIIDGFPCVHKSHDLATQTIVCTTAEKTTDNPTSLVLNLRGFTALTNTVNFYYGLLWSEWSLWGKEPKPKSGDSVYVAKNTVMIVDESTVNPLDLSTIVLKAVIVEGTLLFIDLPGKDITFDAHYIVVKGDGNGEGNLMIGTEDNPYSLGTLTITMHGGYWDSQLPDVGNKGIACMHCSLDIHGKRVDKTWTELSKPAEIGDTQIEVFGALNDWKVGDQIVIASTDFHHEHAEQVTITDITPGASTTVIKFSPDHKLVHYHHSGDEPVQDYQGTSTVFTMRAEVGLLTRSVKIQGDQNSRKDKYGAHMMMHGRAEMGTRARIEYAEFTMVGQPAIIGRYPIHFHMNGDVSNSYVIGNAVHESYARVCTIHAIQYLTIKKNVGYDAAGHNFFFEDGIERHNVLEENLAIHTRQVWSMLQSDITAASYWVTNPDNELRNNRAAGGDFYGFWYELKEHPDGPSATSDICPQGLPLGDFDGNKAHSYVRFGLRVFKFTQRDDPCVPTRDDSLVDPYSINKSYTVFWKNFETFKNQEDGVLCEFCGDMVFQNFKAADNKQSSFNVHRANFTANYVRLENWIIVGKSAGNNQEAEIDADFYHNSRGIITPRTDGFLAEKIGFNRFVDGVRPIQSCSECYHFKKWPQGGKEAHFRNIHYDNSVTPNMAFFDNWRNAIFWDMDGTLTKSPGERWVTTNMPHLREVAGCVLAPQWDDGLICDKKVTRLDFYASVPTQEFRGINLQIVTLSAASGEVAANDPSLLAKMTNSQSKKIKNKEKDNDLGFVAVLAAGNRYNIKFNSAPDEWRAGIDWRHFLVGTSESWKPTDDGIIIEFSYIDFREVFQMFRMIGGRNDNVAKDIPGNSPLTKIEAINAASMTPATCNFGDYIHDDAKKTLTVCFSGKGRVGKNDKVDMNGLPCKLACPVPAAGCVKETKPRKWHIPSDWYHFYDPKDNTKFIDYGKPDNMTVLCEWRMFIEPDANNKVDITVKNLTVRGSLQFNNVDKDTNIYIKSSGINIYGGQFILGEPAEPFLGNAVIEMQGIQTDNTPFVFDQIVDVGNKVIGVTGLFQLIGPKINVPKTRLSKFDESTPNVIQVEDAPDWKVGDTIVVAPSGTKASEWEKVKIQAINGKSITLASSLVNWHYGASKPTTTRTFQNPDGSDVVQTLDMRAVVAQVNRNIKIQGNYIDDWGCRIFVYRLKITETLGVILTDDQQIDWQGVLNFDGVEIENCGQRDTTRGAIDIRMMDAVPDELLANGPVVDRKTKTAQTVVANSAIHDCKGYCWNSEESNMWTVDNTLFLNGRPIMMGVTKGGNDVTISNCAFIGAMERNYVFVEGSLYDMKAFIYWYKEFDVKSGRSKVFNNIGQGSDGPGFVFPHVHCEDRLETINNGWGFYDNTATTTLVGFMFQKQGSGCQWAGRASVALSGRGFMVNPTVPQGIIVEYVIAVENERGVVLRFATAGVDRKGFYRNSYISNVARLDCPLCYVKGRSICDGVGTQMLVVTNGGEDFPLKSHPFSFDVICNSETFDSRLYVNDVIFENYQQSVTGMATCGGGHAFSTHPSASDMTAGHYLWDVDCFNCDHDSKIEFRSPSKGWLGWFGGCGEFLCTGPDNVIVHDWTGRFLNINANDATKQYSARQAIAHNELVGDKLTYCKRINGWNGGYDCEGTQMSIFQFESIAPDRQARMHAPVTLQTDLVTVTADQESSLGASANIFNRLNAYREWEWDGPEPMNKRENRFISLAQLNSPYNVTWNGLNPYDIIHKINDRTTDVAGEPEQHIVFKYHYPVPLSIRVYFDPPFVNPVTNKSVSVVKPVQLHEGAPYPLLDTTECGHNHYFYKNNTVHFVVTGHRGCHVKVQLIDSVWVTMRLQTTVEEFYNSDSDTQFIDRIGAFLNITTDRLKIVSAFNIKKRILLRDLQGTAESNITLIIDNNSTIGTEDSFTTYQNLNDLATQLQNNTAALGNDPKVNAVNYEVKVSKDTKTGDIITEEEFKRQQAGSNAVQVAKSSGSGLSEDETVLAIVLAVVLGLIFIIALVGCYCVYKKYKQKKLQEAKQNQVIYLNESNDHSKQILKPQDSGMREGVKINDDAPLQMPGQSHEQQNDIPDF